MARKAHSGYRNPMKWTNTTGATVALNAFVLLGIGWAFVPAPIAAGKQGTVEISGVHHLDKVSTDVFTVGDTVYWNTSTKKVATGSVIGASNVSSVPIGVARASAGDGTTTLEVELNAPRQAMIFKTTGDASGGVQFDTGLGKTPSGPVHAVVRSSAGVNRVIANIVWGTGGNLGKVTVTATGGAAGDEIIVTVWR